ncbi:Glyco hydro 1 domain containing protein, partial [Asbolus verrucosus]
MLKNLGVTRYRFSLSWSRILPMGFINKINQAGVDYYLITALKGNGIEPYVTLYHWDLPQPLQNLGGWPNPLLVDYFADYTKLAFTLFGDDVKNWMTFNEPKHNCQMGYGYGYLAPAYMSNGVGSYLCAHTVLKTHAKAYHIYDEEFRATQNGRVTMVIDTNWFEPANDSKQDKEAAERKLQFDVSFRWYANPIYNGNYPQVMIDRIADRSLKEDFLKSRLPESTLEEIDYIKGTYDFFAVNHYTTNLVEWSEDYDIGNSSTDADIGDI